MLRKRLRRDRLLAFTANLPRCTAGVLRGRPGPFATPDQGYHSANAERVELRLDCGYTVDGEIFETGADEIVTVESDRRIQLVRA